MTMEVRVCIYLGALLLLHVGSADHGRRHFLCYFVFFYLDQIVVVGWNQVQMLTLICISLHCLTSVKYHVNFSELSPKGKGEVTAVSCSTTNKKI